MYVHMYEYVCVCVCVHVQSMHATPKYCTLQLDIQKTANKTYVKQN